MTSNLQDDQSDELRLAQGYQSLAQEQVLFELKKEEDRKNQRLQRCFGWVVLLLLPAIAVFSAIIIVAYHDIPGHDWLVNTASASLFTTILGLVVSAYKIMLPQKKQEAPLAPETKMPELPGKKPTK